tara:strand:- start:244 stop:978 length:735 start_codon:yes stop_codon:yes gene_type:complete
MLWFGIKDPENYIKLGAWGDFFGGTLNPVLSFIAILGLLLTIVMQRDELSLTRQELSRSASALENQARLLNQQSFENTFFNLLSLHNEIVNSIDLMSDGKVTASGRDCFTSFHRRLGQEYRKASKSHEDLDEIEIIRIAFENFWSRNQTDLGHYFRLMFNIVKFVSESEFKDSYYIKFLRAQISDQELVIIFYNCLTPQGQKFKKYAEKYSLFDNIEKKSIFSIEDHCKLFEPVAFGEISLHNH